MTGVQLAALAGALLALGLTLLAVRWLPVHPDLATALDRLAPERSLAAPAVHPSPLGAVDRIGGWAARQIPLSGHRRLQRDLDLLGIPVHRLYGQSLVLGALGLAFPVAITVAGSLLGLSLPVAIPAAGSVLLGCALGLAPVLSLRSDAAAAREQFTRALGAYIDLVALERLAGAGPRQAMEAAAQIGDSWPFRRIAEELARSRWSGLPAWDALGSLSEAVGVEAVAEISDIMRLSGEQGAAVYQTLRARSAAIRAALVTDELAAANRAAERLTLPGAVLALTFAVLLTAPAVARLVTG